MQPRTGTGKASTGEIGSKEEMSDTEIFLSEQSLATNGWKAKPSALEGYYNNYSTETHEGDRLSVDFNLSRQMVRISLKLAIENGREYITTIKSGTILEEREKLSRHSLDLTSRLEPFGKYFAKLQNPAILRIIGRNFNLHRFRRVGHQYQRPIPQPFYLRSGLRAWLKQHLKAKREREARPRPAWRKLLRRLPQECFDIGLGGTAFWMGGQGYLSFAELACFSGFFGVYSGMLDWLWRQRSPFIPKIAFFMGLSAWIIYLQIQYRMWAIYL